MIFNDNQVFTREDAPKNLYKIFSTVDTESVAILLENNKPAYVVISFDEYQEMLKLKG